MENSATNVIELPIVAEVRFNKDKECSFSPCGKKRHVGELCAAHYDQKRRGIELRVAYQRFPTTCTMCGDKNKPKTPEFFNRTGSRLTSRCKDCLGALKVINRDRDHVAYLKRMYNVSDEWYRNQVVKQQGKCAICGTFDPGGRGRWSVDHDHSTGEVRELLCAACNTTIGYAHESPETLEAAAAYIRRHAR